MTPATSIVFLLLVYVTQITSAASPSTTTTYGSKEYYLFNFKLTFLEAFAYCKRRGMTLAEIMSTEENTAVLEKMKQRYANLADRDGVWLGATDLTAEGEFIWLDSGRLMDYEYFHYEQPDNWGTEEHCLGYFKNEGNIRWNDFNCASKHRFICQWETKRGCC